MSTTKRMVSLAAGLLSLGIFAGCESTDGGSSSASVGVYYGTGFYDPWYYGGYYEHHDVVVTPPVRPVQPIYKPSAPRPTPMPSIPSAPRPMPAMRR